MPFLRDDNELKKMATDSMLKVCFEASIPEAYLVKWKVKPGSKISQGTVLLLYDEAAPKEEKRNVKALKKMKATMVGTVTQLLKNEGECICHGCAVLFMKGCSHPIVMKDMCAECGADLREIQQKQKIEASVAMIHSVPELVVSDEQAQILGKADEARLLQNKKLVLLVDLDQTLIHTTNDDIPPNLKDVHHFQLRGFHSQWYHARIRPGTQQFLEKVSQCFELHICTFGARTYAHTIARILDKDGRYFSHRILSRDECFNANSKTANLRALFPCGDNLVCIIDDRADVWSFAPNLVQVKPYHFFQHTGDINAPPGLSKTEKDSDEESKYFAGRTLKLILAKKNGPTDELAGRASKQKMTTGSPGDEQVNVAENEGSDEKDEKTESSTRCLDLSVAKKATNRNNDDLGHEPVNPVKKEERDEKFEKTARECDSSSSALDLSVEKKVKDRNNDSLGHEPVNCLEGDAHEEKTALDCDSSSRGLDLLVEKKETDRDNVSLRQEPVNFVDEDGCDEKLEKTTPDCDSSSRCSDMSVEKRVTDRNNDNFGPECTEKCEKTAEDCGSSSKCSDAAVTDQHSMSDVPCSCDGDSFLRVVEKEVNSVVTLSSHHVELSTDTLQDMNPSSSNASSNVQEKLVDLPSVSSTSPDNEGSEAAALKNPKNSDASLSSAIEVEENLDVEDDDDYLLYLSDILTNIHKVYYEMYDRTKSENSGEIPDMKRVIPYVRKKVLRGVRVVFSGVIPTNLPVEKSRAFYVARSLGAEIQPHVVHPKKDNKHLTTTHVVAARLGTVKVNEAKKCRGIHIVTPNWLWCCADRWERVDEQLFILNKDTALDHKPIVPEAMVPLNVDAVAKLHPHELAPTTIEAFPTYDPVTGKRINRPQPVNSSRQNTDEMKTAEQQNGSSNALGLNSTTAPANFATSINPLLSFSSEEIANMDQEVEDLLDSPDTDEEDSVDDATRKLVLGGKNRKASDGESSSDDSLNAEHPHGWRNLSQKRKRGESDSDADEESESDDERPKYPRCELPEDTDRSESSEHDTDDFENSVGSVDEEMAAAVEREFLGL